MKKYFSLTIIGIILIFAISCEQDDTATNEANFLLENGASENSYEFDLGNATNDTYVADGQGGGIYPMGFCIHDGMHGQYFHMFSSGLEELAGGQEKADEWSAMIRNEHLNEKYATENCFVGYGNIVNFVKDFDISREDFQAFLDNSGMAYYWNHYNLEVIYSGDDELIEAYYSDTESIDKVIASQQNDYLFKMNLQNYIRGYIDYVPGVESRVTPEQREGWIAEKNAKRHSGAKDRKPEKDCRYDFTADTRQWSIAEIIYRFDVPRADVEKMLEFDNIPLDTYNLDFVYSNGQPMPMGKMEAIVSEYGGESSFGDDLAAMGGILESEAGALASDCQALVGALTESGIDPVLIDAIIKN